ncbi:MAG: glycosyl transferase [Desulfobacteraceae bacterium 4572_35.1]|nr:MAG: glycosyl transferase [Desulfobacteraceae bacterium 4572_35.1]
MKVSIVTVCYNSEATIRDTIESVLAQSYSDIEYIIVDGASSDRTMAIIDEYRDRITNVVSESDKGIYDAMNKGIKLATGDVVGILNSDDFYQNNAVIHDVVCHFDSFTDSDVVFGDVVFVAPGNLEKIIRFYRSGHFRPWKLRFGWMPPHPATFIKKRAYDQFGLYSLGFKISSDYEMFVRLLLVHKLSFSRINKVLVRMRTGGVSTAGIKSRLLLNKEIVRACRKNGIYTNLLFVLSKLPFKLMELFYRPSERLE